MIRQRYTHGRYTRKVVGCSRLIVSSTSSISNRGSIMESTAIYTDKSWWTRFQKHRKSGMTDSVLSVPIFNSCLKKFIRLNDIGQNIAVCQHRPFLNGQSFLLYTEERLYHFLDRLIRDWFFRLLSSWIDQKTHVAEKSASEVCGLTTIIFFQIWMLLHNFHFSGIFHPLQRSFLHRSPVKYAAAPFQPALSWFRW